MQTLISRQWFDKSNIDLLKERVMFYRQDANTVTVVDEPSGKLVTTYPLRHETLERYETEYIEIVP